MPPQTLFNERLKRQYTFASTCKEMHENTIQTDTRTDTKKARPDASTELMTTHRGSIPPYQFVDSLALEFPSELQRCSQSMQPVIVKDIGHTSVLATSMPSAPCIPGKVASSHSGIISVRLFEHNRGIRSDSPVSWKPRSFPAKRCETLQTSSEIIGEMEVSTA